MAHNRTDRLESSLSPFGCQRGPSGVFRKHLCLGRGALVTEGTQRELRPGTRCWRKRERKGDWLEGMCWRLMAREKGKAAFWGDAKGRKLTQRPEK